MTTKSVLVAFDEVVRPDLAVLVEGYCQLIAFFLGFGLSEVSGVETRSARDTVFVDVQLAFSEGRCAGRSPERSEDLVYRGFSIHDFGDCLWVDRSAGDLSG